MYFWLDIIANITLQGKLVFIKSFYENWDNKQNNVNKKHQQALLFDCVHQQAVLFDFVLM